ncbi:MAG: SDR family oxidoreductase [Gammaproteobacteria bacterium]|nr:SDR family oxidoreductase [Gammaproteobacteria bacterium]
MHSLKGKVALITGGTSGIGLAVAKNFADNGASVTITGRRDSGAQVARDIGAIFVQCDATDEQQVAECFDAVEKNNGKIDILVVNAGTAADEGSIEEFPTDKMRHLVDVNLGGVFIALKYGPRHMNDDGSIITTGSVAGAGTTNAGAGVYAASKAGVAYLTRTCALELASRGIRANTVCPALIAGTGMMTDDDGGPEALLLSKLTAFGRMGRQEEVVGAYNFLASQAATFITGQELRVDGGMTAGIGNPIFSALG